MKRACVLAATTAAFALLTGGCVNHDPLANRPALAGLVALEEQWADQGTGTEIVGEFPGAGASSQETAMGAWISVFQDQHPGAIINYDPSGSGAGREQFLAGGAIWAGSDAPLNDEEIERSQVICGPEGAIDLPIYVSPIALAFNIPGVDSLNLRPEVVAKIFTGEITSWDDPAIAADNPGVALPALRVTPVHRTDNSGTTENFADYLIANAPDVWLWEPAGSWPLQGGDSAQGTAGVIGVVNDVAGAITYADASRVGTLATAAIKVGDEWVKFSPEGAAIAVDASPEMAGRHAEDLAIAIDRTTEEDGAYPLILISYAVVCLHYDDVTDGDFVQQFIGFIASPHGQQLSAWAAGSSPISPDLEQRVLASLNAITLGAAT